MIHLLFVVVIQTIVVYIFLFCNKCLPLLFFSFETWFLSTCHVQGRDCKVLAQVVQTMDSAIHEI